MRPLPPGKLGLPLIGQNLAYVQNPFQFIEHGVADYGPVFKARLLLSKTAVITGPEACERFLDPSLVERAGAFPIFVEWLFGGRCLPFQDGKTHLRNKQIVLAAFSQEALASYLPSMQEIVEKHFEEWTKKDKFQWLAGLKRLAFEVIATNLLGPMTKDELAALQEDYEKLSAGLVSAPVPLRFTRYGQALQAKQRAFDVLRKIVKARMASPQDDDVSLIGVSRIVAARSDDGQQLSEDQAVLEIHHVVLAGFAVFGHLVTAVLRATSEEQVREKLSAAVAALPRGKLTIPSLGQIHYLQQFVMEVKRLSPIIPVLFGRAKRDFKLHGVRIPAGWRVLWALRSTNLYRPSFPHRQNFDPSRYSPFPQREEELHQRFIYVPQSGGPVTKTHACAGFCYSALLTSVFTAILVRDYQWSLVNSNPEYNWRSNPPEPVDGLPGTVTSLHSSPGTPS
jgi:cytochrome P450